MLKPGSEPHSPMPTVYLSRSFPWREWALALASCATLYLLNVGWFSLALLFLSLSVQWWLWSAGAFRTGVILQLALLASLKVYSAFGDLPGGRFPSGFSFYSLSILSLQLSSMKGRGKMSFSEFFTFLAYAPKFFAGPIETTAFLRELRKKRSLRGRIIKSSALLIAWGAFKKFCVAEPLWPLAQANLLENQPRDLVLFFLGLNTLALHFYAEFSGYVDIARGISRLLGIRLSLNFRYPFLATNPQDFWQRWHLTLSSWLRDNVFYPVFFRSKSVPLAIASVFLAMGLWHGFQLQNLFLAIYWTALVITYLEVKPWILLLHGRQAWRQRFMKTLSRLLMLQLSGFAFFLLYSKEWISILQKVSGPPGNWTPFHWQSVLRPVFFLVPFALLHCKRIPAALRILSILYLAFLILFFQEQSSRNVEFMYFQF